MKTMYTIVFGAIFWGLMLILGFFVGSGCVINKIYAKEKDPNGFVYEEGVSLKNNLQDVNDFDLTFEGRYIKASLAIGSSGVNEQAFEDLTELSGVLSEAVLSLVDKYMTEEKNAIIAKAKTSDIVSCADIRKALSETGMSADKIEIIIKNLNCEEKQNVQ